ncbi:MAG: hypothetical protein ACRCV3_06020 [Desulfovibrionaceae bacterium]
MRRLVFALYIIFMGSCVNMLCAYAGIQREREEDVVTMGDDLVVTVSTVDEESAQVVTRDIAQTQNPQKPRYPRSAYRSTFVLPLFSKALGLTEDTAPMPFTIMLFGNYLQNAVVPSNFGGNAHVHNALTRERMIESGTSPFLATLLERVINGMGLGPDAQMPLSGLADVTKVQQRFVTAGGRFAVNVLPFVSVYGIFANSTGTTQATVFVDDYRISDFDPGLGILPGGDQLIISAGEVPFDMKFDATSYGIGTAISIGTNLFFSTIDANYVITTVEGANVIVHTVTASTRVGLHKTVGGTSIAIWLGGNYMENVAGSDKLGAQFGVERLGDLFPINENASINLGIGSLNIGKMIANSPADISWLVNQRPASVFSVLFGMKYSPAPNIDITAEVTMVERFSAMIALGYNF